MLNWRTFFATYFSLRRRDLDNSLDGFLNYQQQRCQQLLKDAHQDVPFQSRRIKDPTNFLAIEPTDKKTMMAHLPETLNSAELRSLRIDYDGIDSFMRLQAGQGKAWMEKKLLLSRTSGTSGRPGNFWSTRREFAVRRAIDAARDGYSKMPLLRFLPRLRPERVAVLGHASPLRASGQILNFAQKKLSASMKFKSFRTDLDPAQVMQQLEEFQPNSIRGYPTFLALIASLKLSGIPCNISPKAIYSGADLLTPRDRSLIERAFPESCVFDAYGAIDCGMIAFSCVHGSLHLSLDTVMVEPVDELDRPVSPGHFSHHILVTDLVRTFQPVIRYRLDDSIRILTAPCPCGSVLPQMEIRGRLFPTIYFDDDEGKEVQIVSARLHGPIHADPRIPWCQFHYEPRNHIRVTAILSECPLPGELSDANEVVTLVEEHMNGFIQKYNASKSLTFEICCLAEAEYATKAFKRRMMTTAVRSRQSP